MSSDAGAEDAAEDSDSESSGQTRGGGADADDKGNMTKSDDYRAVWLSTAWSVWYGFGFPAWVFASSTKYVSLPPGTAMTVMTTIWIATVVYIIGPGTVREARKAMGK